MKKAILALVAAAILAAATVATPSPADAQRHGWGWGPGLLGLGAGIVIGSALATHPGYYAYEYNGPPPVQCDGYWGRRRVFDQYGNQIGWSEPRWFCR